jgi:hypothetical protein
MTQKKKQRNATQLRGKTDRHVPIRLLLFFFLASFVQNKQSQPYHAPLSPFF